MMSLLILPPLLLLLGVVSTRGALQPSVLSFDGFWAGGVAVDNLGSVYASSYYGDVVYRFNSSTGQLLGTLDSSPLSFVGPTALAWDSVYSGLIVADTVRYGWARLSASSSPLPFFPLAPSLPPPTAGSYAPGGVAVDPVSGTVYLGQYYASTVEAWAANGSLLWTSPVYADRTAAEVRGMTVDAGRVLWLADYDSGAVVQFSWSGERLAVVQSAWLDNPWGLAVDAAGGLCTMYVAAYGFSSVDKLNCSGQQLTRLQSFSTQSPSLDAPAGLALDDQGHVYVGDPGNGRLVKFNPDGSVNLIMTVDDNVLLSPVSLVFNAARNSLIVLSDNALSWVSLNGSVVTPLITAAPLSLADAGGLALDSFGNLLVVNTNDNQLLSVELEPGGSWNTVNKPQTQLAVDSSPGIAVDAAGSIYMADSTLGQTRVLKMYNTGQLQTIFLTSSPALLAPAGVAVTPDGSLLYCADQDNNRVVQWSTAVSQTEPSQVWSGDVYNFTNPVGLVVDPAGNVFLAADGSIYQLHPNGSVSLACAPALPPANQSLSNEYYTTFLTVDNSGNLYLADYWNYRIIVCPAAAPAPIPSSTASPFVTSSSSIAITSSSSPVASSSPLVVSSSASATSSSAFIAASSSLSSSSTVGSSPSLFVTSSSPSVSSSSSVLSSSLPPVISSSFPSSAVASSTSPSTAYASSAAASSSSSPSVSSSLTAVVSSASLSTSSSSPSSESALSSSTASASSSAPSLSSCAQSSSVTLPSSASPSSARSATSSSGIASSSAAAAVSSSSAITVQSSSSAPSSSSSPALSSASAPVPSAPSSSSVTSSGSVSSSSSGEAMTVASTASSSSSAVLSSPPEPWPPAQTSAFSFLSSSSSSSSPAAVVSGGSSSGLAPGAIAGIVVGVVVACCLLLLCLFLASGRGKDGDKQQRKPDELGVLEAPVGYHHDDVLTSGTLTPATPSVDSTTQQPSRSTPLSLVMSPAIGNSMGTFELVPRHRLVVVQ